MHIFREKRIANGISYYMPTPVARTGTCARPQFWRSQRSSAHTQPLPPNASPDADPQMHVWSVRYGRCACAKTSGIKVQPRHPSGCLVLNPRDPGRAVWQYPVNAEMFSNRQARQPVLNFSFFSSSWAFHLWATNFIFTLARKC